MENIIIHIISVGFHHKRGCEIEYIYPSFCNENLQKTQFDIWKNLPSLALPDGAHKSSSDTINFILPGIIDSNQKVLFGISCFKQISAESVKTKTDDMTRNTIQKSIVVLASLPLFGAIGSLLRGITENYFEMSDFEDRNILSESFHQLNQHFNLILEDNLTKYNNIKNLVNQDLSIINLLGQYEHGLLTLVKMILLRRKVLFFMEPMDKLTSTILSLISLFPGVLETASFQRSFEHHEESTILDTPSTIQSGILKKETESQEEDHQETPLQDVNKSENSDQNVVASSSLFQNLKSGGGHTFKVLSGLTYSGANSVLWGSRSSLSPESESNKLNPPNDLAVPLPPFVNADGYDKNSHNVVDGKSKVKWEFPLEIFDEKNILLPYASIGMLNILDNSQIDSFIIGANNQLWKMKAAKCDLVINEDIKNGGMELSQAHSHNKHEEFHLGKLLQLTVLDRRFIDYLLQIVKSHYKTVVPKTDIAKSESAPDLLRDVAEDPIASKTEADIVIHRFSDSKELEEWLREVLLDYIKAILLNAAALGTKLSFEDFGWNFLLNVQQQSYFERWYNSIDKTTIISESTSSLRKLLPSESALFLNIPSNQTIDSTNIEIIEKPHSIMNYDHPGRFIPPKTGDHIPGYYQFREYADHSKALVNKSVSEIKRISAERGSQLKSSVSAGLSRLTGMAKVRGIKLGSTWWQNDPKTEEKVSPPKDV